METKYSLLRADYWVQTVLGVIIITCFISVMGIFFGLLLTLLIGGWQVLSALIFNLGYKERNRRNYIICTAVYLIILYAVNQYPFHTDWGIEFWILAVFAAALGIWYYVITRRDFKSFDKHAYIDERNDNILDA